MNVERWIRTRKATWGRLEDLLGLIEARGLTSLNVQQLRDLGQLYKAVSADLSRARAWSIGGDVQSYLNLLLVKAHNQVYQKQGNRVSDIGKFLLNGFPELVQQNVLYVGLSALLFLAPLIFSYFMVQHDVSFANLELSQGQPLVPEELWNIVERHQIWTDNIATISPVMFSFLATHNIQVAIQAFIYGITFGIGTIYVLFVNGLSLGTIFGACKLYNVDGRLFAFAAPHGVLELSAIIISGGAGLIIGKSLLFPGKWRRLDALRLAAKTALGLFGGCIPLLIIAGSIEGFVSGRTDIPSFVKYWISCTTAVFLAFYLLIPREMQQDNKTAKKLSES